MELFIDNDFRDILPPLTDGEYTELENSIKAKGVLSPILVWNGYIVDGHNRYEICCKNGIEVFETKEVKFGSKEEVLEWILSHQLGRRNLNDFQRNEVALKYQDVISKRMKERQATSTGGRNPQLMTKWSEAETEKTTARKELANIANTSEGSIQRSKLILEHGTQEQIYRARKGGAGNSVSAIAKEITLQQSEGQTKICSKCGKELSVTMFYPNKTYCKPCHFRILDENKSSDFLGRKVAIPESIRRMTEEEVVGNLYDTEREIEFTDDDLEDELKCIIENFHRVAKNCLELHKELLTNEKSKEKVLRNLTLLQSQLQSMKEIYDYE